MQFGMFMEFATRPGGSEAEAFREGLALAEAADAWGLDAAWLAEFHFVPDRSVLSSPITLAADDRRAHAPHPDRFRGVRAALEPPDPDRGGDRDPRPRERRAGRPRDRAKRLHLVLRGVRGPLRGEPGTVRRGGRGPAPGVRRPSGSASRASTTRCAMRSFARFRGSGRHPPFRMAATRGETFPRVGAAGLPIFVGLRGDSLDELAAQLATYREAWREAGHPGSPSAFLRLPVHAAATGDAAREEARGTLVHYFKRQSELVAGDAARRGDPPDSPRYATAARLATLDYDDILVNRVDRGLGGGDRRPRRGASRHSRHRRRRRRAQSGRAARRGDDPREPSHLSPAR